MKVGIITNPLDEGHPSYSVYIKNLIDNINSTDNLNEYYLIHHTKMPEEIYHLNKEILVTMPNTPLRSFNLPLWRYYMLPKILKKADLDIIHDTSGSGLLSNDLPYKKIITYHGLSTIVYPGFNIYGRLSHALFDRKLIKNVDKIIAVSESTKREIIKYLRAPSDKISVVYNGKSDIFKPIDHHKIIDYKQNHNLNFPFILFVGVLQPIKNIPTLIKAYYKLKKAGTHHKLVIAGGKGWKYKDIFTNVENLNLQKDVIFLGNVPHNNLPLLYNSADLFVFPSLYEGFGLPPLESMSCGTPVITSNVSSLPEIVGDAGITIDPYNIDSLYEEMKNILSDNTLREELGKKGLNRSKLFSWKKCSMETIKIYNSV